jgi:hypothetical protein
MSIDQAETVLDSQVQGDAEILKSVLREELKQVGVDVPIDTDVFVTALSTPERIAYVTAPAAPCAAWNSIRRATTTASRCA